MDTLAVPAPGFRKDIQGLRAIAVLLVVLYHIGVPGVRGGYIGVDVFFVISGFLITGHLVASHRRTGRIDFGDFYARRARRILPAALMVIVATTIGAIFVYPAIALPRVIGDALSAVLMIPNIVFAARETDYLADHSPSLFQHYWSLGVEEQFYLVWPVLLFVLLWVSRRRSGLLIASIATVAAVSFVIGMTATFSNQPIAFFLLPSRAWELLIGGLVGAAVVLLPTPVPRIAAIVGGWLAFGTVLASATILGDSTPFPGYAAALPVLATAALLYFGAGQEPSGPLLLLGIRPFQFLGAVSFSLYLLHWPILVLAQKYAGDQAPLQLRTKILLGLVVAAALAWLSYRFIEQPMRTLPFLTSRAPRSTLVRAIAVGAAVVISLNATAAWAATREGTLGPAVAESASAPVALPEGQTIAPSNLTPALEDVSTSVPDVYDDGCHLSSITSQPLACTYGHEGGSIRIVVFGDSHSAQWLPAVQEFAAHDDRIAIQTHTKSSCPAVGVTVRTNNVPNYACDVWRTSVLQLLERNPPDLVVISSASSYELDGIEPSRRAEAWRAGLESTLKALRTSGSAVLVVADTPRFEVSPPLCLSTNPRELRECSASRADVFDEAIAASERSATEAEGALYADLNDFICNAGSCPVVIANLLVYRDANHLTVPMVRYLAPALSERLTAILGRQ